MSAAKVLRFVSMALGLAIALMGLLNVMPDYGVLPRIGPFPTEPFRAIFFAASCLCLLSAMAACAQGAQGVARAELGVIAMAAVAVLIVSREYWRVNMDLANSMVLFGAYDVAIAMLAAALVLYLCWAMGMVALGYLIWGQYLPGFLASAPADFSETVAGNVWFSTDQGILGSVMAIVLSTVLPFIILGGLLDGVGAGKSMIRISFSLMRHFAGGPAYAAIVSSALFGTVSQDWRGYVICEYDYSAAPLADALGVSVRDAVMFMVFDGRWKLIHFEGGFAPMLFDLQSDPGELINLGPYPAYESQRVQMYDRLFAWARRSAQRTTRSAEQLVSMRQSARRRGILLGIYDENDVPLELSARYCKRTGQNMTVISEP